MPKITTMSYGKTFNLGNYESQRFDVTAELREGEEAGQVMASLEVLVEVMREQSVEARQRDAIRQRQTVDQSFDNKPNQW